MLGICGPVGINESCKVVEVGWIDVASIVIVVEGRVWELWKILTRGLPPVVDTMVDGVGKVGA
jgi:hypothetical protein